MFESEKIVISDLTSVIHVKNNDSVPKIVRYGPKMPRYELIYKNSGENYTNYNGKRLHNYPGVVQFLPKCEKADYTVERIEDGDCIDIFFETKSSVPKEAFAIDMSANKRIKGLYEKIYGLWISKQDGYYLKCMALFYEILAEVQKPYGEYLPKEKYAKIEKGIEYLHQHCLDKDVDYYKPAQLCGISYTHFKKIFRQKFNVSPIGYVTRLKMERAKELIISGHYSVTETAQLCGFENVYYFSNVFKKEFGVSPKNYSLKL